MNLRNGIPDFLSEREGGIVACPYRRVRLRFTGLSPGYFMKHRLQMDLSPPGCVETAISIRNGLQ